MRIPPHHGSSARWTYHYPTSTSPPCTEVRGLAPTARVPQVPHLCGRLPPSTSIDDLQRPPFTRCPQEAPTPQLPQEQDQTHPHQRCDGQTLTLPATHQGTTTPMGGQHSASPTGLPRAPDRGLGLQLGILPRLLVPPDCQGFPYPGHQGPKSPIQALQPTHPILREHGGR